MTLLPTTIQENMPVPAGMSSPAGEAAGPTTTDVVAMIRRRVVLITVLTILFLSMSAGGFASWWFQFPGYQSEALIDCVTNIPDTGLSIELRRLREEEHEKFVMTQARLMKSPSILGAALKVNTVRETDWFASIPLNKHLLDLTDELHAAPVRGTTLLRVAMECRNPKDAAVIVNEVVTQWRRMVMDRSAEDATQGMLAALRGEMDALNREIKDARDRQNRLDEQLPPGALYNPGGNITHQQVREYAEQEAQRRAELAILEPYRKLYDNPEGAPVALTAEDRAFVELDPQVAQASQGLFLLEQERAAKSKTFGHEHVVIRRLDSQIDALQEKVDRRRTEVINERRRDNREAAMTAYDVTRLGLYQAQENRLKAEAALEDQDRVLVERENIQQTIEENLKYRQVIQETVKNLQRIKTQRTAIQVNIEQRAIEPLERHSPTLWLIPVGVFLSFTLSFGLALGLEMLDKSVRTSQDVMRYLDVALLGLVPDTDDEEIPIQRVERAYIEAPQSMMAEAFRRLRTNLQFCAPAERQRSIVVTSPRPDDGKTTVACNLAMALAEADRRVLLVDANLRKPGLQDVFDKLPAEGLSNLLIGDGALSSYVTQTENPKLDLLGSGPSSPNPAELLGGVRFKEFLAEATSVYDQVVIDSAPVLLASDSAVLARAADGVIMVVRATHSSRGVARRACAMVAGVGAHLLGVVLNGAQVTRGGYFREELRAYYQYQPEVARKSRRIATDPPPPSSERV